MRTIKTYSKRAPFIMRLPGTSSLLKFPVHLRQTLHFGFMGHDAEVIGIDFDPLQLARFETLLMLGPLGFAIGRGCRRLP